MSGWISRFALLPLLSAALLVTPATLTHAGDDDVAPYETAVIVSGLERPTGITVDMKGILYFTELPTPGVPGSMGGSNTVSKFDPHRGQVTTITMGEPEPTNIDITKKGQLFWTCKSAGVILKHVQGVTSLVQDGLEKPSGIAVQDVGPNKGDIYFTQIPTPGIGGTMGGMNTVSVIDNGTIADLSMGEPEPSDVAVDKHGNLYWTCKTAGVILQRDGNSSEISLLLSNLNQPNGIAVDNNGNLYFTEVPTPGISGSQGGQNKVWKYDLSEGELTLVDEGDPEPTDVAVSMNGKKIYWTCSSAGVIVQATLVNSDDD
jgi:hypothetical protein